MARLFLKSASDGLHPHQYDISSVTSIDFGDLLPVMSLASVPTDDWQQFQGNGVLRLQAQNFPTFGKAFVKTAAFFVPEHQLFEDSDAFHQDMSTYKGKAVHKPYFSSLAFIEFLVGGQNQYCTLIGQVSDPTGSTAPSENLYDFVWPTQSGQLIYNYYKLTRVGERLYKVYKLLGYDFPSFPYDQSFSTASAVRQYGNFPVDATPLLAYVKVYVDMFLSGTKYNYSEQVAFLHAIRNRESFTSLGICYDSSTGQITAEGLSKLLFTLVPHESSMYTQAWNSLNSPDGSNTGSLLHTEMPSGLVSPVLDSNSLSAPYNNTVHSNNGQNYLVPTVLSNNGGIAMSLSSAGLRFLQAFDRFVRRWNLSGTKAVQKVYSQFGIKSDDFNSHFVHKLYEGSSKIDFSPVLSNADTKSGNNGKTVGDYAGFGVSGLDINFDYKSSDYGYIIVVSWIQIVPMLLRGFDPEVLKRYPQDFYTPEFDGKASRAIPLCEVSVNKKANDDITIGNSDGSIYGFTNVYDEYRYLRDRIAGAFVTDRVAKNFLLSRDLSVIRQNGVFKLQPQTDSVHYWDDEDNADVTNPFQNSWSNGDRFYLYIDWNIKAQRPMLSDSESFDLGTGDIQIQKNGDMMS